MAFYGVVCFKWTLQQTMSCTVDAHPIVFFVFFRGRPDLIETLSPEIEGVLRF